MSEWRELSPVEIAERASVEVQRRLEAFDAVWEFVISHDTSASANGYDFLSASVEGEWYEKGAGDVLEQIREVMT